MILKFFFFNFLNDLAWKNDVNEICSTQRDLLLSQTSLEFFETLKYALQYFLVNTKGIYLLLNHN